MKRDPFKIGYPTPPDWSDPSEESLYSPTLGEYLPLDPAPPPPSEKGRTAQEKALRRHGFDSQRIKRPPIAGRDEVNEAGFLIPEEETDLRNEER